MAAQLMLTKGSSARGLQAWMARARRSLPVPVSPRISTGVRVSATWRARAARARTAGLRLPSSTASPSPASCVSSRRARAWSRSLRLCRLAFSRAVCRATARIWP